jgi:hypothetical protein
MFFPHYSDIQFIGKSELIVKQDTSEFSGWSCGKALSLAFTRSPKFWDDYGERLLRMVLGETGGSKLFSFEGITDPNLFTEPDLNRPRKDPVLLAEHIKQLRELVLANGFENFKVVMMVRNQKEWLGSMYAQTSDRNKSASQLDFENQIKWLLKESDGYYFYGIWLDYDWVTSLLETVCGKGNIILLPQEQLLNNQKECLERISEFFGEVSCNLRSVEESSKENVRSIGSREWQLRDLKGIVEEKPKSKLARIFGRKTAQPQVREKSIQLTEKLDSLIEARFEGSNKRLDERMGLELKRWGYWK